MGRFLSVRFQSMPLSINSSQESQAEEEPEQVAVLDEMPQKQVRFVCSSDDDSEETELRPSKIHAGSVEQRQIQ